MAHHVSFQAIETYLNKNIYPLGIIGDKGKKASFRKHCKPLSKRHHTIISDVRKGLGYDLKARAITLHCGKVSAIQKISKNFS